jgi:hypothetical protein
VQHPSKDVIYCLSYPRSGSSWFRYCLKFITNADLETTSDEIADAVYDQHGRHFGSELLHHSHRTENELWSIENCFDIKNILLLRNYKEAIFSEMKSAYSHSSELLRQWAEYFFGLPWSDDAGRWVIACFNYTEVLKHIAAETNPEFRRFAPDDWKSESVLQKFPYLFAELPKNETILAQMLSFLKADQFFSDFVLPDFPTTKNYHSIEPKNFFMERPVSASIANHYHFILQLKRYYNLLEYHDKVSKTNPNNALMIKYEDFIENPFFELNRVIDFMEETHLVIPEDGYTFRDNLDKLIDNIEHHKHTSINRYKGPSLEKDRHIAHSYGKDNKYTFHSSQCRKEFLIEIDNILKNKNLELFSKYLSDYEEGD